MIRATSEPMKCHHTNNPVINGHSFGHSQSVHTLGESSQVFPAYEKQMREERWIGFHLQETSVLNSSAICLLDSVFVLQVRIQDSFSEKLYFLIFFKIKIICKLFPWYHIVYSCYMSPRCAASGSVMDILSTASFPKGMEKVPGIYIRAKNLMMCKKRKRR